MSSNSSKNPVATCFSITELLKSILERLDDATLLLARLVNHKFRAIILNNRKFNQRLRLALRSTRRILGRDNAFRPPLAERPGILVGALQDRPVKALSATDLRQVPHSHYNQSGMLNPFLLDVRRLRNDMEWPLQFQFDFFDFSLDQEEIQDGRLSATSPLRDTYLSHPMPTHVRFESTRQHSPGSFDDYVVHARQSLRPRTLGEMMDEVADQYGQKHASTISWRGLTFSSTVAASISLDWRLTRRGLGEKRGGRRSKGVASQFGQLERSR